ncbi:MAG: hypothetical protein SGJ13_15395 [Actinomycetota bacterium]|nr:hypothetical protein [Actinomycetota bacterium]
MAVDESRRLHLYEAARDRLGRDAAETLMELLPMDESQLATKHDIALLKQDLVVVSAELRSEISALRAEMHDLFREQTNRIVMFLVPTMLTGIGLAFAAAQLGA